MALAHRSFLTTTWTGSSIRVSKAALCDQNPVGSVSDLEGDGETIEDWVIKPAGIQGGRVQATFGLSAAISTHQDDKIQ
ncbi:hypothetical protein DFJ77DRAFT_507096 [Powellomyces hirtus]|nr:hypothetical protein DFJ77DRAFT_507096 [Powellomyces hirtus]